MNEFISQVTRNWRIAWANKRFRNIFILEIIICLILSFTTTVFFDYIESLKGGIFLNDWVLRNLPVVDVSIPIVTLEATVIFLSVLASAVNPNMAITLLMALGFQLIFRILSINFTRFLAPQGILELKDPIGSMLYHSKFITRDLFYSGHTAALFIFYLFAQKKSRKYFMLCATLIVAFLLLLQHVHYTVDVLCAPLFAFGCFWLSKQGIRLLNVQVNLD